MHSGNTSILAFKLGDNTLWYGSLCSLTSSWKKISSWITQLLCFMSIWVIIIITIESKGRLPIPQFHESHLIRFVAIIKNNFFRILNFSVIYYAYSCSAPTLWDAGHYSSLLVVLESWVGRNQQNGFYFNIVVIYVRYLFYSYICFIY